MHAPSPLLPSLLALVLAPGCGPAPPAEGDGIDLLVRAPDERFEHPGQLVPDPLTGWGDATGPGWASPRPEWQLETGVPWVQANQPIAHLRLLAPEPEDRSIELVAWWAETDPFAEVNLRVKLNGFLLDRTELSGESKNVRLKAIRDYWKRGWNALELEAPGSPAWNTLALAAVQYGSERRVDCEPSARRLALADDTGVRYTLELTGPAELELAGTGRGKLRVAIGSLDPRTGELSSGREVELRPEGALEESIAILPIEGALTVVDLDWNALDEEPLTITRAKVFEREPHARPPVLLISIDTLAARHMSVYGYDRPTTPELEAFAADAITFERCVANAPWTLPSYLSALTGLYPKAHFSAPGSYRPGLELDNFDFWRIAENRWTLAEMLRGRGYQTAASVDSAWLTPRFRFDQGFDLYDIGPAYEPFEEPDKGIRMIVDQFERWLDTLRHEEEPFFAFIQALDAHGPYWPEPPYFRTFDELLPEDLRPTPAGSAYQTYRAIPDWMALTEIPFEQRSSKPAWDVPAELPLEAIIARYDEAIQKTDHYIGRALELLKERGIYDEAIVVVTADHGESFAHQVYSHGVLWEDVVQIPLMIKLPGGAHGNRRVEESVQLVDLYPTLHELVGARSSREHLHGRSLLALIEGEDEPRVTFCEGGLIEQSMIEKGGWKLVESRPGMAADVAVLLTHPRTPDDWIAEHVPELARTGILTEELKASLESDPGFMERLEGLRASIRGPYYELYDLSTDPHEEHDVYAENPAKAGELQRLLEAEKERGRRSQADASQDGVSAPMSAEELRQLDVLGYGGGESEPDGAEPGAGAPEPTDSEPESEDGD